MFVFLKILSVYAMDIQTAKDPINWMFALSAKTTQ